MRLLLDTHALLWWLSDDPRLEQRARTLIADPDTTVLASAVSLWEIVVKVRIGKLEADIDAIVKTIEQQGFTTLPIDPYHLATLAGLQRLPDHRDPFDHLLIAQAIAEGATLVSEDRNMPRYPVLLLACSDAPG
ncbi:PilT protein domain protein [Methylorubrum thiocyanatum]